MTDLHVVVAAAAAAVKAVTEATRCWMELLLVDVAAVAVKSVVVAYSAERRKVAFGYKTRE